MTERLSLAVAADRAFAWVEGDCVRHLVATLSAERPEAARAPAPPVHLALVIDASGSMAGDKLENAKTAALGVAERLRPIDRLSIVSFAEDVIVHVKAQSPSGEALSGVRAAIHALATRGNTNLSEGWLMGAECVASSVDGPSVNRVILLSDGAANAGVVDPQELAIHAAALAKGGVATSCVGIGDGYQISVLQAIAEHGGGRLHDAEVGKEIVEALMGELGEIGDLAAQDVSLTLYVPATAKAALLDSAPTLVAAGSLAVSLGSLLAGRPRTCVFRITLPAGRVDETLLFSLSARGTAPGGSVMNVAPAEASFALVEGARNNKQPRDLTASLAVAIAWHAEIVRRAARMNREGERRQARSYVEREWPFFERYCAGLPEAQPLLREIAILKQNIGRDLDERTRKEMELGAYASQSNKADYRAAPRPSWSERINK